MRLQTDSFEPQSGVEKNEAPQLPGSRRADDADDSARWGKRRAPTTEATYDLAGEAVTNRLAAEQLS